MVEEVLGPEGPLSEVVPGWEPRPGQIDMAKRIALAMDWDERLLVEAGTGTGKTFAYLVPALLSGRKVVVATGTRNLQDQIVALDIPRLAEALRPYLPMPLFAVNVKGLSNYVCLRRLALAEENGTFEIRRVRELPRITTMTWPRTSALRCWIGSPQQKPAIAPSCRSSGKTPPSGRMSSPPRKPAWPGVVPTTTGASSPE